MRRRRSLCRTPAMFLAERKPPCSPDGKWKASMGSITMDAGEGQQFDNARVSCIAGPCPFTRIETGAIPRPGRKITVTIRNWSDTVTFLVEAEVTRRHAERRHPASLSRHLWARDEFHSAGHSRRPQPGSRPRRRRHGISAGARAPALVGRVHPASGRGSNQAVSLRIKAGLSSSDNCQRAVYCFFSRSCT